MTTIEDIAASRKRTKRTLEVYEACENAAIEHLDSRGLDICATLRLYIGCETAPIQAGTTAIEVSSPMRLVVAKNSSQSAPVSTRMPFKVDYQTLNAFGDFERNKLRATLSLQLRHVPNSAVHSFVAEFVKSRSGRHFLEFHDTTPGTVDFLQHLGIVLELKFTMPESKSSMIEWVELTIDPSKHNQLVRLLRDEATEALIPRMIKCAKKVRVDENVELYVGSGVLSPHRPSDFVNPHPPPPRQQAR